MPRLRIVNDSDEPIELGPGESADLRGERDTVKGMVQRRRKFTVDQQT